MLGWCTRTGRSSWTPACLFAGLLASFLIWPSAPSAAPVVAFDWERPARYTDTDADGLPDPRNTTDLVNAPFTVRVDACGSSGDGASITEYRWRSPGSAPLDTASCTATLEFTEEGTFPLTLTIATSAGDHSATQDVKVEDHLIVSLGDSFASGEGIPHSYGLGSGAVPLPVNVKWQAEDDTGASRCHRSAYAGAPLAAAWLEEQDPETSVTFVHLACSGAKIEDQMLAGDHASGDVFFKEGGMLDPYRGVEPRTIAGTGEEAPQVDQAAAITGSRQIDAMTLSIGGNDLHFASIIKDCLVGHASRLRAGNLSGCDLPESPSFDCGSFEGEGQCAGVDEYNQQVARLAERFGRLDTRLGETFGSRLDPSRLFLTEYPNPTRCDDGQVCAMFPPLISGRESGWADSVVLPGLNGALRQAAEANDWSYVGGISEEYESGGHGYAAEDSWFVSLPRSFAQQAAKDGAFHPNKAGQRWYRNRILAQLVPELDPDTPLPPENVGSDPWDGGPFEDMDLVTDRDGDLIPDVFDNCPSVVNYDQKDERHDSNGAEGYTSPDGIGDACGLVADMPGGTDGVSSNGKCDQSGPQEQEDNTPCSLSSAIEDGGVSGRINFLDAGFHASGTSSHPVPRIQTGMVIDGTATPLFNQNISAGSVSVPKISAVSLPVPRCMAMIGRPCVQLEGDLRFFEAEGAEVTGVQVVYENFGLEFENTTNARVYSSWIGSVDESGAFGGPGVVLRASGMTVGGPRPWDQNVISGNEDGIQVLYDGPQRSRIQNNLIGTGANGRDRIGNTGDGISVTSSDPIVEDNVIAASERNGIAIGLPSPGPENDLGATILGNRIGLNDSEAEMGNGRWGVRIDSSSGHTVGGEAEGDGNQIAHNDRGGIQVQAGRHNEFSRNEIWDNGSPSAPGALGINLAEDLLDSDVPTANDPLDIDGEPGPPYNVSNNLQNFPQVISVEADGGETIINAALESRPDTTYRLEFFVNQGCEPQRHGEGESFLVAKTVTTSDNGKTGIGFTVPETLEQSDVVTATATSPEGDTSEFSTGTSRRGPCTATHVVNSALDGDDGDVKDGLCDTGSSSVGYSGVCTLRAAITQANWLSGHETIGFAIGSGAQTIAPHQTLPVITDPVTIDGTSQPGFAGTPLIRLDGAQGGSVGIQVVEHRGTRIRGLSVTGWSDRAITARGAPFTYVEGNFVGLEPDGQTIAANAVGVYITDSPNSSVGGTDAARRNVISGNDSVGVYLQGTTGNDGVTVQGNRIGTNPAGTAARPNATGITVGSDGALVGGPSAAAGNVISGNTFDGLHLSGRSDVASNLIGTDAKGKVEIPNGEDGIQLAAAPGAEIGFPGGGGNTIAFNGSSGIDGWAGTSIRRNAIFENSGPGISLVTSGPPVLEPPTLTSVKRSGKVRGTISGEPSTYGVELFASRGRCNDSVEARSFMKLKEVTIAAGDSSRKFEIKVGKLRRRTAVTAVLTQLDGSAPGNTSEISGCR